jgi:hypothetical protein
MDTYEELTDYLKADFETRYQIHKAAYFKLYPESTIEKFYRFEAAYLKRQINKYEKREIVEPLDTEIYISQIEVLEYINSISSAKAPQQAKKKEPTKIAIALFCNLINEVEIIKQEVNEIPEIYCERICKIYNLEYSDRVRQNFNGNKSKKHYKQLTELILPRIDELIKDKIQKHLDTKNLVKQNLYG